MKLALISDLHLPHWHRIHYNQALGLLGERCAEADIVINAGDTGEANSITSMKDYLIGDQPYLEAKGNHDYYGGTFKNEFFTKEIGGFKFFVGTLWTNFNKSPLAEVVANRGINDFRLIKGASVETMKAAFYETKKAIEEYRPQIVVTHFAPFLRSVAPKYGETPLNFFFCNNMKNILNSQTQIRVWIHGHSHTEMDYQQDFCRVLNHPLGYVGENYVNFSDYHPKIIEV